MNTEQAMQLAEQLKYFIQSGDLDKIHQFCALHPEICKIAAEKWVDTALPPEIQLKIKESGINAKTLASLPPAYHRLVEALLGKKQGSLSASPEEQLEIIKNHIPGDFNLRQFDYYRKQLGGAWILWKLGGLWKKVLPNGELWTRDFIVPMQTKNIPLRLYPVPDLSFAPLKDHKIIKTEQVVKKVNGSLELMPGKDYNKLSDAVKINITKAATGL